jgi:hypothetical protein
VLYVFKSVFHLNRIYWNVFLEEAIVVYGGQAKKQTACECFDRNTVTSVADVTIFLVRTAF